jgi:hypothetical protein
VFENRVLRRIFESKRDEVTGGWRKLRKTVLCNLYSSSNIYRIITLRIMGWTEHVAGIGAKRTAYRLLVGIPE